jgi:endonuclease/exonuclease/phosphatase family metal-dependent hydrolase
VRNWTGPVLVTAVLLAGGVAAVDPQALTDLTKSETAATVAAPWSEDEDAAETPPAAPGSTESAAEEPAEVQPGAEAAEDRDRLPSTRLASDDGPQITDYSDELQVDSDLAAFVQRMERAAAEQLKVSEAPLEFGLATFNVLGAVHTAPGSDADHYAPWRMRAEWTASYIQQRRFDVVGLQEVEAHQLGAIMRATRNEFDAWPGTQLPKRAVQTSVLWRKSKFEAVQKMTLTINFMQWQQQVPAVKLRDLATQRTFWVLNVHNAPRSWESQRDAATRDELALINQLRQAGERIFFFGDMNERDETACKVFAGTDLVSPAGGSNDGRCILPANRRIDWIFGPPDVQYSGYVLDRSPLVQQSTDHFVPQTRVTIK